MTVNSTSPVALDGFLRSIKDEADNDPIYERLGESIARSASLGSELNHAIQELNFLDTRMGPLLHSGEHLQALANGIKNSTFKSDYEESIRSFIPEFMVNQASRLLDFLNLVCRYKPDSIEGTSSERVLPVTLRGENFLIQQSTVGDGCRHLYFQKAGENPTKFDHSKPYFHYCFEPNLHTFALAAKSSGWLKFQQGMGEGSKMARLLTCEGSGEEPNFELASRYDDTAKKVFPVSTEKFLSEDQYIARAK